MVPPAQEEMPKVCRVPDFYKLSNREFIHSAYRYLLKRAVDPQGEHHYLAALTEGRLSRIEILGRLRYSPEGRRTKVYCPFLSIQFALACLFRIPVIGWFAELVVRLLFFRTLERRASMLAASFENRVERIEESVQRCFKEFGEFAANEDAIIRQSSKRETQALRETLSSDIDFLGSRLQALEQQKQKLSIELNSFLTLFDAQYGTKKI